MNIRAVALSALLALSAVSSALAGHHPLAELYDRDRTMTLRGVVTGVEWVNPHAVLVIAVQDAAGAPRTWRMELDPPGYLQRREWPRDRVVAGMTVTVLAFPSRSGAAAAVARTVTLASGEQLVATTDASWNWKGVQPAARPSRSTPANLSRPAAP